MSDPGLGSEYEVYVSAYYALLLYTNPKIKDFKLRSNVEHFKKFDDLMVDIKTKSGEDLYLAFQLKHKKNVDYRIQPNSFYLEPIKKTNHEKNAKKKCKPKEQEKENRNQVDDCFNLVPFCEAFKKLKEAPQNLEKVQSELTQSINRRIRRKKEKVKAELELMVEEKKKGYHLILYTNKTVDYSSQTNALKKFNMKQDECNETRSLGENIFNTSKDKHKDEHLYKFEVNKETEDGENVSKEDYREFFSQFSLYTRQADIIDLEKIILDILKYKECYATYIDFFRRWHRGDFFDKSLDKKTLNAHLVDIFLSSVAINYHLSDGEDENSKFFETMVQQFDITIIDASKQDFIKQLKKKNKKKEEQFNKQDDMIQLAKDNKFVNKKFSNKLTEETKLKLLYYFKKKPLILDFNENTENLIYEASKFMIKENEIKLVIVGRGINTENFSSLFLETFTNSSAKEASKEASEEASKVNSTLLLQIKEICKLSLGDRSTLLGDEICELVTPRDIFQMLNGSFSLGEENLPKYIIPRTVSTKIFDIESIKHFSRSAVIIICDDKLLLELQSTIKKIMDREDYFWCSLNKTNLRDVQILRTEKVSNQQPEEDIPTIILVVESSRAQLEVIRKESRKDDVHIFKLINDEKRCLLLLSTKNISNNEKFSTKMSFEEDNFHVFFNNSVNILCAKPGMGKSVLMRRLQDKCDPSFWTIRVDLKSRNQFLKENPSINTDIKKGYLSRFLQLDNNKDELLLKIKKKFFKKQKIVFFFDGLDEVENECVDYVLNITSQLSKMGFKIWLSARQNLQQKLEQYFNIFAIEIDGLNENQQKVCIEKKLESHRYNKNKIDEIVEKIFSNTNLANNRQILEIPLQLQIITQIFIDDKSLYSNLSKNNNFILTEIFEIFKGKYKHFVTKFESRNPHLFKILEEQLEKLYEIVGLHSVLDDEHFNKLQIKRLMLAQIKNSDFLGIITAVNAENKAVFDHLTFAEYFAATFLEKNSDEKRILKEENKEIIAEKYRHVPNFLNSLQS